MTDILKDKTSRVLTSMSIPISMGMLSTFLFQIVDTYFVGKLGADALAALSFSSTIFFILVGLFIGLSVGVSIIVGQAIGANDKPKVFKTVKIAIVVSSLLAILLSTILIGAIDPIFINMGASNEILILIRDYTIPVLIGMPLLTTGLVMGGILRASGNILKPEIIMAVAGLINLFLDYVLIFGYYGFPELGIVGAAYATVLSWVFIIIGMIILMMKDGLISLTPNKEYSFKETLKEIWTLSTPTILTQIIGPFTLMYLTFLLAQESSMAVAAFGIAGRLEILLMIGILSVGTAITPFIAQNQGAKNHDRIEESIVFGGKSSAYMGLLVGVILMLMIKPIAGLFSDSTEVVSNTVNYFYIVSLSYAFYGLFVITTSIFNGLKLTSTSLKINLVKSLLFTLPLTFIGSYWGVNGIFMGVAISNVLAGIYSAKEMRRYEKLMAPNLAKANIWKEYRKDLKRLFSMSKKE